MALAKYAPHTDLRTALNRAVEAYFEQGPDRHGTAGLWLKSAVIMTWAALSYGFLVFFARSWWEVLIGAISLGLAAAGIGFNIQHDGGHGSYSSRKPWNRIAAWSMDLVGASSYIWHFKHNILHHHYTNIAGLDDDLEAEPFLRLAPSQPRLWHHRFQYLYTWLLYGFLPPKWHWYDDFKALLTARVGGQPIPRPKGWNLVGLIAGKVVFATWTLVIPMLMHPVWKVLLVYALACLVVGVTISTVFQLAHCLEEAEMPTMPAKGQDLQRSWAEHQLATTSDFSPGNPMLTWYLGGLNFQVEHHLFPRISHVHYSALAPIVRRVCADFSVEHLSHSSLWKALRSHLLFLKRMGRP